MNTILPGNSIQNVYAPLMSNTKIGGGNGQDSTASIPFGSVFTDALRDIKELDAAKEADSFNLALGDIDDLSGLMVNGERAQTALNLLVELRNKVLDSYSEIMRINV